MGTRLSCCCLWYRAGLDLAKREAQHGETLKTDSFLLAPPAINQPSARNHQHANMGWEVLPISLPRRIVQDHGGTTCKVGSRPGAAGKFGSVAQSISSQRQWVCRESQPPNLVRLTWNPATGPLQRESGAKTPANFPSEASTAPPQQGPPALAAMEPALKPDAFRSASLALPWLWDQDRSFALNAAKCEQFAV